MTEPHRPFAGVLSSGPLGYWQFEEQVLNRMKYFRADLIIGGVFSLLFIL